MSGVGLVLSGGGARGAYEVGVLCWIAEHRPEVLDAVRVVTGASVGAVNAMYLASRGLTPRSVMELEAFWTGLELRRVLHLSATRALRMLGSGVARLFSDARSPPVGLFETGALEILVKEAIDWDGLEGHVRDGRFDGVAVAATEIASGRTHVFADHHPDMPTPRWPRDQSMIGRTTPIRCRHVLASASIPFLFPPIQIGDHWYTDGGIRQNTPLSPALRLGAEHLLVVALAGPDTHVDAPGVFPGLGQLLGKLFNSLFLDRMMWDLDRLDRINDLLEAGATICGPEYLERLHGELHALGRRPYRPVRYVTIRPEADLGMVAARVLREPHRLRSTLQGPMRAVFASDDMANADAASFLLFDGCFARELIALGREDAAAHAEQIDRLLH